MRTKTLLAMALVAGLLPGCACLDRCRPGGASLLDQAATMPPALQPSAQKAVVRSGEGIVETKELTGVAVGAVIAQLRLLVADLANLAQTVGGETRATIVQLEGSTAQLAAEMDERFKNRLGDSVDRLEGLEKRMVQGAVVVINHTAAAADQLRAGAEQSAFATLQEAGIASYEALSELPCNVKERVPRLVYTMPRTFRIWAGDARSLELRTRGNFIDSFGSVSATVNGIAADAKATRNDLVVTVPASEVARLQQITAPTTLLVEARMSGCRGTPVVDKQVVTVLPPLKYAVAVRTSPVIEVPIQGQQSFHFEDTGGCDSDYRVDRRFPVGPPAKAVRHWVSNVSANCGSAINSRFIEGEFGVTVHGQVKGCGKDCVLGICNCRGRGWLKYDLHVATETWAPRDLPVHEERSTAVQASYTFAYPFGIPAGQRLQCRYQGRVQVDDGGQVRVAEFTESTGPVDGITHEANATCDVTIAVPSSLQLRS